MMRFYDSKLRKDRVTVQPGEMYVTRGDEIIYTILGSCISVCLHDPEAGVAGMNHFMLPKRSDGGAYSATAEMGRYGDEAVAQLLKEMLRNSANISRLTAKVFGGAAMISKCCERNCVSKENAETAFAFLAEHRIPVYASDTGGACGRRIFFDTYSGNVLVEPLRERGFESCRVVLTSEPHAADTPLSCCKETRRMRKSI